MDIATKIYSVRDGDLVSIWTALLRDVESTESLINKSSDGVGNHYDLALTAIDSMNAYRTYRFAMNEMEAQFNLQTNELITITIKDTSIHKKIEFVSDKGTLVYARGQDVIGLNSELNDLTTKEYIHDIEINSSKFEAPFEIKEIYQALTGVDLDAEETPTTEELEATNMWFQFFNSSEE